jgi:HSP20 family molecular chaperone IbpA
MEIEETIGQVEHLYRALTGKPAPQLDGTAYAPIPPEKDPVQHVQDQIERLGRVLSMPAAGLRAGTPAWTPAVSIWESSAEVIVCVDLPGIARERLDVRIEGNLLVVAGDVLAPPPNGRRLVMSERPLGPFHRAVPLPAGLRTSEMSAQLSGGILEVHIPREPEGASRSVPIA